MSSTAHHALNPQSRVWPICLDPSAQWLPGSIHKSCTLVQNVYFRIFKIWNLIQSVKKKKVRDNWGNPNAGYFRTVRNDQFLRCNHRTTAVLFKEPFSLGDVQGRNDRRNDTVSKISFDRIQLGAGGGGAGWRGRKIGHELVTVEVRHGISVSVSIFVYVLQRKQSRRQKNQNPKPKTLAMWTASRVVLRHCRAADKAKPCCKNNSYAARWLS